jgi:hypothetical protein
VPFDAVVFLLIWLALPALVFVPAALRVYSFRKTQRLFALAEQSAHAGDEARSSAARRASYALLPMAERRDRARRHLEEMSLALVAAESELAVLVNLETSDDAHAKEDLRSRLLTTGSRIGQLRAQVIDAVDLMNSTLVVPPFEPDTDTLATPAMTSPFMTRARIRAPLPVALVMILFVGLLAAYRHFRGARSSPTKSPRSRYYDYLRELSSVRDALGRELESVAVRS